MSISRFTINRFKGIPFSHCLLPISHLARLYRTSFSLRLIAFLITSKLRLHIRNSSIIEYLDGSTIDSLIEFGFTESLTRHIKVGYVKLK